MSAVIASISVQKCTFCMGPGHNAKQCAFKKNLDKAFANAPPMRKIWGTLKSTAKRNGAQIAQKQKAIADVLVLEAKAKDETGLV